MDMQTILVCVDFSDLTDAVLDAAASLAELTQARVVVIHVEPDDLAFVGYEVGPTYEREYVARAMWHDHQHVAHLAKAIEARGLNAQPILVQGATGKKIMAEAEKINADVIVIGTHGHGAIYDLFMGSIAKEILNHAKVPVMVVPRVS